MTMKNASTIISRSRQQAERAQAAAVVTWTLNGERMEALPGETVYAAAQRAGESIPGLCASSHLTGFGSCRLCLCEVEGQSGTPASCTTPVREGMVVWTESERLTLLRRHVLELSLSEHASLEQAPAALRELARELGLTTVRYAEPSQREAVRDDSNPFFAFDNAQCISCARCVRACHEIQGTDALTMVGRGFASRPMAGDGQGFLASTCVSCGACVKECPTGALVEKSVAAAGQPAEWTRTVCAYCGVGCGFEAGTRDGRVVAMVPTDDTPSNLGHACMKGRFGWSYIYAQDRLRVPRVREGSQWRDISWDEAVDRIAQAFTRLVREHGRDAVATISSSRGTNEENYLFAKFMRCVIGTNHIDNCARVCHSATVTGMMETLGASAATNSLEDLDAATLVMAVGANLTESHPVVGARVKHVVRKGVPLIVIDPRRTELARVATLHLALQPGTNVALLNAMGRVIVEEGLLAPSFIEARTEGFEEWRRTVLATTLDEAERITGVPVALIRDAARRYATSAASYCVHGLGMTEHRWGSHGVMALVNLALAAGQLGRPGTGINPLRGQNNVQGASDMGCLPTSFAGYQPFSDETLAARHLDVTGRPLPTTRGMKTPDMWEAAIAGRLKGLWIIGYDVAQTDPNTTLVHHALKALDFLVVQDLFMSETAKLAHLVIPGAAFLEKDGTFTNLERRVQRIRKVVDPPEGLWPDWQVVSAVSTRMGYPMHYAHPSEIMDEVAALTPLMGGVSFARLEQAEGLQWPVPTPEHPGTGLMHAERFPKGRASFIAVDYLPPGETPDATYPFLLITGRILQHYGCGAQSRRTAIVEMVNADVLEMHPDDAAGLHLSDNEMVRMVSARGTAVLPVSVSTRVQPGHLFTSFHFPESDVNTLLSSSADERSKCPEYKVSAVRVERLSPADAAAHAGDARRHRLIV